MRHAEELLHDVGAADADKWGSLAPAPPASGGGGGGWAAEGEPVPVAAAMPLQQLLPPPAVLSLDSWAAVVRVMDACRHADLLEAWQRLRWN